MANDSGKESIVPSTNTRPLCIDLDGTLIRSDMLIEAVFGLLKQNPFYAFFLPLWLAKGKAHLKQQIAERVDLDVTLLPYNERLLTYLREEKAAGRRLILATASNVHYAEQVALHLGFFDEVLASDAKTNLSGPRKGDRLVAAFGERGFDYAANEGVDLPIWAKAGGAILVDTSPPIARQVQAVTPVVQTFSSPRPDVKAYLKAIRLHQWLKNVLVFVPVVMAHEWGNTTLLLQAAIAFLAFGLCASSVYVLNDLLDLEADRQHPTKRRRPFAAGMLSLRQGLLLIPLLLGAAFALALLLPPLFLAVLAVYYAATLAYSLRLKSAVLIDVLVLAGLYTLRVIAGGAATGLGPSFWLLAFSMFLFLSLALVKRYSELLLVQAQEKEVAAGRGYRLVDLETLAQFGMASGYAAVLVLALYINSTAVGALYRVPEALWLICPLFLYWISRVWLLARRNLMHQDPVLFAIEDRRSHWLFVLMAGIVWAAT
jgi:4-hydroxybenzoate polyprenyltransferase/phosphoserine phosphatase